MKRLNKTNLVLLLIQYLLFGIFIGLFVYAFVTSQTLSYFGTFIAILSAFTAGLIKEYFDLKLEIKKEKTATINK